MLAKIRRFNLPVGRTGREVHGQPETVVQLHIPAHVNKDFRGDVDKHSGRIWIGMFLVRRCVQSSFTAAHEKTSFVALSPACSADQC